MLKYWSFEFNNVCKSALILQALSLVNNSYSQKDCSGLYIAILFCVSVNMWICFTKQIQPKADLWNVNGVGCIGKLELQSVEWEPSWTPFNYQNISMLISISMVKMYYRCWWVNYFTISGFQTCLWNIKCQISIYSTFLLHICVTGRNDYILYIMLHKHRVQMTKTHTI